MARKHIPYIRFYPADFLIEVRGLSAQEVGVLKILHCRMYEEDGPIEFNELRLSTYCGMRQKTFVKVLQKLIDLGKLTVTGGMISSECVMLQVAKRADDLENKSSAGKASAKKRSGNNASSSSAVEQVLNNTNTNTDTDTIGDGREGTKPTFREELLLACGHDISGVTPTGKLIAGQAEMAEFNQTLGHLKVTEDEALMIVRDVMRAKRDGPPNSFKYFFPALNRMAEARDNPDIVRVHIGKAVPKARTPLQPQIDKILSENPELDR